METVLERFLGHAERHPDKTAFVFEDRSASYEDLRARAAGFARWFREHGVGPGDRVVVQMEDRPDSIAAVIGAWLCGAAYTPAEKSVPQDSVLGLIRDMDAKAVVSSFDFGNFPHLRYAGVEDSLLSAEAPAVPLPDPELPCEVLVTSGTTGVRKAAVHTHRSLAEDCLARDDAIDLREDDVGMTFVPMSHAAGLRYMSSTLWAGSTYIFLDGGMKIKEFYDFMERLSVTSLLLAPSAVVMLEKLSGDKLGQYSGQIDYVYSVGAMLPEPQRDFLHRMLPDTRLFCVYGSSETGVPFIFRYDGEERPDGCVGRPGKGVEVRFLDASGNDADRRGRIAVRSGMNFIGYRTPSGIDRSAISEGYYLTNDEGYMDDEGFVYVLGRADDVINIGGLKVHPSEIENAALELGGISECLCVDAPDSVLGSTAMLLAVAKPGHVPDVKAVRAYLASKLEPWKVPSRIEFTDAIRKNSAGKPDRASYRNHTAPEKAERRG